jgi:hypothetical protein
MDYYLKSYFQFRAVQAWEWFFICDGWIAND